MLRAPNCVLSLPWVYIDTNLVQILHSSGKCCGLDIFPPSAECVFRFQPICIAFDSTRFNWVSVWNQKHPLICEFGALIFTLRQIWRNPPAGASPLNALVKTEVRHQSGCFRFRISRALSAPKHATANSFTRVHYLSGAKYLRAINGIFHKIGNTLLWFYLM